MADIAREAMCSENTIKSRLNYARKAMKEGIEHKERQMGVKLHVVTGPMIVFVLRGMFSSMTVSAQKARYTWMAGAERHWDWLGWRLGPEARGAQAAVQPEAQGAQAAVQPEAQGAQADRPEAQQARPARRPAPQQPVPPEQPEVPVPVPLPFSSAQ